MNDSDSETERDASGSKKGRDLSVPERDKNNLPVDQSSAGLLERAIQGLSDEEMKEVRKQAVAETIKLETRAKEMTDTERVARSETQDHIDSWSVLNQNKGRLDRHTEESQIKTATGERRIVSKSGPGCFVATAVYGGDSGIVQWLRAYRDRVLSHTHLGRGFIRWYYRVGPGLAETVTRHRPLVWLSRGFVAILTAFAAVHWGLSRLWTALRRISP